MSRCRVTMTKKCAVSPPNGGEDELIIKERKQGYNKGSRR